MRTIRRRNLMAAALACALAFATAVARANDGLPSWNDRPTKAAIVQFVKDVTTEGEKDYVPPAELFPVFDNDGTLWAGML